MAENDEHADDVLAKALAGHGLPPELAGELAGVADPLQPAPPPARIEDAARKFGVDVDSLAVGVREARLTAALTAAGDAAYPATVSSLANESNLVRALERLEPLVRNSEPFAALAASRVVCEKFPDAVSQLLRALRRLREQQSTGALEPRTLGLGLVSVLVAEPANGSLSGAWVSVKRYGDNTWKEPRPNPPLVLLVIDRNDVFDPASTTVGPTGPVEARRFVRSPTGPAVVLITRLDGTGLGFKHLYALESDPLARAILVGAARVWPGAQPAQFEEVTPGPDAGGDTAMATGSWRIEHPPVVPEAPGYVELLLRVPPEQVRGVMPGDLVILVETTDGVTEAHGAGRVHHVARSPDGGYLVVLEAFQSCADGRLSFDAADGGV